MDKIREEFEKEFKNVDFSDEDIPTFVLKEQCYEGFEACWESRDEKIKKLRDALEHIIEYWNGNTESAVDAIEEAIETAENVLKDGE